jgi:hypothetical protein
MAKWQCSTLEQNETAFFLGSNSSESDCPLFGSALF